MVSFHNNSARSSTTAGPMTKAKLLSGAGPLQRGAQYLTYGRYEKGVWDDLSCQTPEPGWLTNSFQKWSKKTYSHEGHSRGEIRDWQHAFGLNIAT